eukprot:gene17674-biopygen5087
MSNGQMAEIETHQGTIFHYKWYLENIKHSSAPYEASPHQGGRGARSCTSVTMLSKEPRQFIRTLRRGRENGDAKEGHPLKHPQQQYQLLGGGLGASKFGPNLLTPSPPPPPSASVKRSKNTEFNQIEVYSPDISKNSERDWRQRQSLLLGSPGAPPVDPSYLGRLEHRPHQHA